MTPPKRRTKAAWLIGGIVLMGLGGMIWVNYGYLIVRYQLGRIEQFNDTVKSGGPSPSDGDLQPIYDAIRDYPAIAVPMILRMNKGRTLFDGGVIRRILRNSDGTVFPELKKALDSPEEEIQIQSLLWLGQMGMSTPDRTPQITKVIQSAELEKSDRFKSASAQVLRLCSEIRAAYRESLRKDLEQRQRLLKEYQEKQSK